MKRVISVLLSVIMLVGMLSYTATAAGTLIFKDDFTKLNQKNWYWGSNFDCNYTHNSSAGYVEADNSALVLQSGYGDGQSRGKWWDKFYASFDVRIKAFDDSMDKPSNKHGVAMTYYDGQSTDADRGTYKYTIEFDNDADNNITNSVAYLEKDDDVIVGPVELPTQIEVGEDAAWFEMGIRITDGRIQCYYNRVCVIDAGADEGVGSKVGTDLSGIVFWNNQGKGDTRIALDNFEVWSADYDFNTYGDVNGDGNISIDDVLVMLKYIAKWEDLTVNEDGLDVDGVEGVTITDATHLLKYIADWDDIVLGPQK